MGSLAGFISPLMTASDSLLHDIFQPGNRFSPRATVSPSGSYAASNCGDGVAANATAQMPLRDGYFDSPDRPDRSVQTMPCLHGIGLGFEHPDRLAEARIVRAVR